MNDKTTTIGLDSASGVSSIRRSAINGLRWTILLGLVLFSQAAFADRVPGSFDLPVAVATNVRYEFDDPLIAGIESMRFADIRVRGWRLSARAYVGQTRVGDRWGPGIVYRHGNTVYGLNNRGLQVTRHF